ncbi:MAG: Asp-tRNA(Asn)/Glu-tRNA(Gln) amidotransferase subunit GatC [Firmicutes bacterium]|nr:Asp-tRNA(Asn)/Glu-tRNA(Gln) amidotransferase subunit GatC [Bacillota bacterium]
MKITAKEAEHAAKLAHIKIDSKQSEKLICELEVIARYADMLKDVDTSGVEPTFHGIVLQNVLRKDVVTNNYNRDDLLKNAPDSHDGCFVVPTVVE